MESVGVCVSRPEKGRGDLMERVVVVVVEARFLEYRGLYRDKSLLNITHMGHRRHRYFLSVTGVW